MGRVNLIKRYPTDNRVSTENEPVATKVEYQNLRNTQINRHKVS
ncbi:hypothetical protein yrohd0001_25050 [Yersinia rohdei ATCC 43380]|nr:hypothetical protein yrohd0001_25050 [Yersinia rohdei ATCC 43380]